MKVRKLGIEWGAAFEEAQPHQVTEESASFEFFVLEGYDLQINLPKSAKVEWHDEGLVVIIPND